VEVSRPRPEFTSVPGQRDRLPDAVVCVRPGLVGNVDGDAFGVLATVPLRPRGDQVEIGVRARLLEADEDDAAASLAVLLGGGKSVPTCIRRSVAASADGDP